MENCAKLEHPATSAQDAPQNPAREASLGTDAQSDWRLEPHVCRVCFGRLVSRKLLADIREYRCTNCEATTQHTDASVGCCCGIKIRKSNGAGRSGGPMVDAGIRCIPNPEKTATFPAAYVASEIVKKKRT